MNGPRKNPSRSFNSRAPLGPDRGKHSSEHIFLVLYVKQEGFRWSDLMAESTRLAVPVQTAELL